MVALPALGLEALIFRVAVRAEDGLWFLLSYTFATLSFPRLLVFGWSVAVGYPRCFGGWRKLLIDTLVGEVLIEGR